MKQGFTQDEEEKIEEVLLSAYINLGNLAKGNRHPLVVMTMNQFRDGLKLLEIDTGPFDKG